MIEYNIVELGMFESYQNSTDSIFPVDSIFPILSEQIKLL